MLTMIMISYPIMVTPEVEVSDIKAVYIDNGKQPWMNKSKVSNINHYIEDGKLTNISHRDKNAADTIWLKTYSLESIMIKLKGVRYQRRIVCLN